MRVWVDLTNSPSCPGPAAGHRASARRGPEVHVTARDFAQTARRCASASAWSTGDRPPPRRQAAGQGAGPGRALGGADPLGARDAAASTWRSATAPTTSPSPPRCCASRARRRSTTSGRPCSTPSTAGSRRRVVVPDGDPARAPGPLRRARQAPALRRGSRRSTTWPTSSPTRRARRARPDPAQPIAVVRTPPAVSLYHRFENDLFAAGAATRLRGAQTVVLPRTPEQRAELRAGGRVHRPRARDRRAVADRLRRPRRLRRGDDEPRGRRAGHARVHHFEGRLGAVDEQLIADGRLASSRAPPKVRWPRDTQSAAARSAASGATCSPSP